VQRQRIHCGHPGRGLPEDAEADCACNFLAATGSRANAPYLPITTMSLIGQDGSVFTWWLFPKTKVGFLVLLAAVTAVVVIVSALTEI